MKLDEKGYVMSGFGLLLIIPVMILIPIALSVESQSANLPTTFVKSDSIYYTSKDIQRDMSDQLGDFSGDIGNETYSWEDTGPNQFTGNVTSLYTKTNNYNPSNFGVDSININSTYSHTYPSYNNNSSGVTGAKIPLNNGIMIIFQLTGYNNTPGNNYIYNYTVYSSINSTIKITKNNSGNIQTFVNNNSYARISIDTKTNTANTAASHTVSFFDSLKTILNGFCYQ